MTSTTHSHAIDSTEGCITTQGSRNCNEIGIIPYRRQWRDATFLYTVGCIKNSIGITYKKEGEMITSLVYQV
jgi:hypothetical protein